MIYNLYKLLNNVKIRALQEIKLNMPKNYDEDVTNDVVDFFK
jgi:hypothetical protein